RRARNCTVADALRFVAWLHRPPWPEVRNRRPKASILCLRPCLRISTRRKRIAPCDISQERQEACRHRMGFSACSRHYSVVEDAKKPNDKRRWIALPIASALRLYFKKCKTLLAPTYRRNSQCYEGWLRNWRNCSRI